MAQNVWKQVAKRVLVWLLFAAVLALLPIAFTVISATNHDQRANFTNVLSSGELFLVSVGMIGAAAGEMFGGGRRGWETALAILVVLVLILMGIAAYWSGDLAASVRAGESVNEWHVAVGSAAIYGCSVVTGACCIVLSELRR